MKIRWLDDDEDTETHSTFFNVLFACSSTTKQTTLSVIKLCLNTSRGPVSFGAIGRLLEAKKNRLILIKILSSFKESTIKSWSLLLIFWLLNILLAMLHSLGKQLSYWAHTIDNFITESLNIKQSTFLAKIV